jgi:hypothetical protein
VQSASPQRWKVFTVKWASLGLELLQKRHSVSSQLVKYNIIVATIFMTFRKQKGKKKFDKIYVFTHPNDIRKKCATAVSIARVYLAIASTELCVTCTHHFIKQF